MLQMTENDDDVRLSANQYARAITRWENEGGALEHDTNKIGTKRKVNPACASPNVENKQEGTLAAVLQVLIRR